MLLYIFCSVLLCIYAYYIYMYTRALGRSVLAAWLCIALGAIMIVEQPGSSLLARHPRFQELCEAHEATRFHAGRYNHILLDLFLECSVASRS